MTLAIMFVLGLMVGGSIMLLALFFWGEVDDVKRLHDEDDGERL